jgi:hypothetical protein
MERNPELGIMFHVFNQNLLAAAVLKFRVGQDPEQGAVTQACVRGSFDRVQKLLDFTIDKCRRFPFGS